MHSLLRQQIDTLLSVVFVGAFALGASYLIVSFANKEDYAIASVLIEEEMTK